MYPPGIDTSLVYPLFIIRFNPHPDPLPSREREEGFSKRGFAPLELPVFLSVSLRGHSQKAVAISSLLLMFYLLLRSPRGVYPEEIY